jgi:hypothetical protein
MESEDGLDYKERQQIISKSKISFEYLKRFNTRAGILHTIQGVAMILLGLLLTYSRNVYTFYLKFDIVNLKAAPDPQIVFTITGLGAILAAFPLMSATAHYIIAYPKNKSYNEYLKRGMNPYRWYEYAFSSSVMIVLIAQFLGIWDFWSLVMIFVLNATMIMFGYLMEVMNQKAEKTNWSPFIFGCIAGGTPWVVMLAYFIGAVQSTGASPPTFVYMIFAFYFVLFNIFAVNMLLQYKGVGRWKDYLYGERFYIILSFVAKSILAWIVFIGVFAPF